MAGQMSKGADLIPANWLPGRWKEISRSGNADQLIIKIGHINPNPMGGMKDYYKGMMAMAESGLVPSITPDVIEDQKKQMSAIMPEDCDAASDITIVRCADEKAAAEMLKNRALVNERGIDAFLPGMPEGMTLSSLMKNDAIKQHITPEQIKQFEAASKEMKQMMAKSGIKYKLGEYMGFPAVYQTDGKKRWYQMVQSGRFIVSGMLLLMAGEMPLGSTPCAQLPKPGEEVSGRGGGGIGGGMNLGPSVGKINIPKSTYEKEGRVFREEVEGILEKVLHLLGS